MSPWAPFEWITAIRFLKEGRMQSMFIIAGVAIGVAVIVFMSALLSGLQQNFLKRVLTSSPHIQMIPADEVVLLPEQRQSPDGLIAGGEIFASQQTGPTAAIGDLAGHGFGESAAVIRQNEDAVR